MDDDDKARRNLVVFSSLVVLAAWIRLPLTAVAEKLLSAPGGWAGPAVQPWRVWVAVLAVLAYLALRFRFSTDFVRPGEWRDVWRSHASVGVSRKLQSQLDAYKRKGTEPPAFRGLLSEMLATQLGAKSLDADARASLSFGGLQFLDIKTVCIVHSSMPNSSGDRPRLELDFSLGPFQRFVARCEGAFRVLFYSPFSMRVIVPCLLALLAFAIALYRTYESTAPAVPGW
jgi:hypothetical protein